MGHFVHTNESPISWNKSVRWLLERIFPKQTKQVNGCNISQAIRFNTEKLHELSFTVTALTQNERLEPDFDPVHLRQLLGNGSSVTKVHERHIPLLVVSFDILLNTLP